MELDSLFVRYCEGGDVAALGQVFDAAAPELLGIAAHLLRDRGQMEDVLQSTFITAIERAGRFDTDRSLMPWLVGILANHARKANAAWAKGQVSSELVSELPEPTAPATSDSAAAQEFSDAVGDAIRALPGTYRAVVEQHLYKGVRPGEIARHLGLSANATRVRLHRGLELLRKGLPVGFAGAAVATMSPGAKAALLAATRQAVIHQAALLSPGLVKGAALAGATTSASTSTQFGLALAMKKVLIAGIVATLLLLGFDSLMTGPPGAEGGDESLLGSTEQRAVGSATQEESLAGAEALEQVATREEVVLVGAPTAEDESQIVISGIVNAAGKALGPLQGATVWTRDPVSGLRTQRASTDAMGAFRFQAPIGSGQGLLVQAEGYRDLHVPSNLQRFEMGLGLGGRTRTGNMKWESATHLSLNGIIMWPGTAVTGTVTWKGTGEPAVGMELGVISRAASGLRHPVFYETVGTTGLEGELLLNTPIQLTEEGQSDQVILFAMQAAKEGAGLGWVLLPTVPVDGNGVEPANVEIEVSKGIAARVSVFNEAGDALPDARILFVPLFGPFAAGRSGSHLSFYPAPTPFQHQFEVLTDASGQANVHALLAPDCKGEDELIYELLVSADGYLPQQRRVLSAMANSMEFTVTMVRSEGRDVIGQVLDEEGQPIAGVEVTESVSGWQGITNVAGNFAFSMDHPRINLTTKFLEFIARADGYEAGESNYHVKGRKAPRITLKQNRTTGGRIFDQHGQPVAGVRISLLGTSDVNGQKVLSDEHGEFTFESTSNKRYAYWLSKLPAGVSKTQSGGYFMGGDQYVEIELDIDVSKLASLKVELMDAKTRTPLEAAMVEAVPEVGMLFFDLWDTDVGSFGLRDYAQGKYVVWAQVDGYATGRIEVELRAGENEATMLMYRVGSVTGQLYDQDGEPMPFVGAMPKIVSGQIAPGHRASGLMRTMSSMDRVSGKPDEGGRFSLEQLTPGPWVFQIRSSKWYSEKVMAEVLPDGEVHVDLTVRPGSGLRLQLLAPGTSTPARTEAYLYNFSTLNTESGTWDLREQHIELRGTGGSSTVFLPEGEVRWRVQRILPGDLSEWGEPAEGTTVVTPSVSNQAQVLFVD